MPGKLFPTSQKVSKISLKVSKIQVKNIAPLTILLKLEMGVVTNFIIQVKRVYIHTAVQNVDKRVFPIGVIRQ